MATTAKPAVSGGISVAPVGTTLPTTANAAADAAFKSLGFISEDGVTRSMKRDSEEKKEWGGSVALFMDKGKTETFKFTMIDSTNIEALKVVFGEDNVTGTLETGITAKSNAKQLETHSFIIDMIEEGNTLHRIVIPEGAVTDLADISYKGTDAVGYEVTITSKADSSGQTAYDYWKKGA